MTQPPPGWYSTGTPGEEGWWDGIRWTARRRRSPGAPRVRWGEGSPEASLVIGIVVALLVPGPLLVGVLGLLLGGDVWPSLGALGVGVAIGALAVISIVNAVAGFRRRRAGGHGAVPWTESPRPPANGRGAAR